MDDTRVRPGWKTAVSGGRLVWRVDPRLTSTLLLTTVVVGAFPTLAAWLGKRILDAVVAVTTTEADPASVLYWVAAEGGAMLMFHVSRQVANAAQQALQLRLQQTIGESIVDRASTLELSEFEDADFYDRLSRATRDAGHRPLLLVVGALSLLQFVTTGASGAVVLGLFSPWLVLLVVLSIAPVLWSEFRFSSEAFALANAQTELTREQHYLRTVLSREDFAKDVKTFSMFSVLRERFSDTFVAIYGPQRRLLLRRAIVSSSIGVFSILAFVAAYGWVVHAAALGSITVGALTMYALLIRQTQSAVTSAAGAAATLHEHTLFLTNYFAFLDAPLHRPPVPAAIDDERGLRIEDVTFRYPGSSVDVLRGIDLRVLPGETIAFVGENGAGKSTLIKLLCGLYRPTSGAVRLDGFPVHPDMAQDVRQRIVAVHQSFAKLQLSAADNVDLGRPPGEEGLRGVQRAARLGLAAAFIEALPRGYETRLGTWFGDGRELSGGQWQRVALSRALARVDADVLVLDEPASAMDAEAETALFDHVRDVAGDKIVVLVSHRFSSVRRADRIFVLEGGRICEVGNHDRLVALNGRYAQMFEQQAAGYR